MYWLIDWLIEGGREGGSEWASEVYVWAPQMTTSSMLGHHWTDCLLHSLIDFNYRWLETACIELISADQLSYTII